MYVFESECVILFSCGRLRVDERSNETMSVAVCGSAWRVRPTERQRFSLFCCRLVFVFSVAQMRDGSRCAPHLIVRQCLSCDLRAWFGHEFRARSPRRQSRAARLLRVNLGRGEFRAFQLDARPLTLPSPRDHYVTRVAPAALSRGRRLRRIYIILGFYCRLVGFVSLAAERRF